MSTRVNLKSTINKLITRQYMKKSIRSFFNIIKNILYLLIELSRSSTSIVGTKVLTYKNNLLPLILNIFHDNNGKILLSSYIVVLKFISTMTVGLNNNLARLEDRIITPSYHPETYVDWQS